MKIRVRWREECVYERVVEVDEDEWADALQSNKDDDSSVYTEELVTDAVIDQADYMADLDSCEDREILDVWVE